MVETSVKHFTTNISNIIISMMCVFVRRSVVSNFLQPYGLQPTRSAILQADILLSEPLGKSYLVYINTFTHHSNPLRQIMLITHFTNEQIEGEKNQVFDQCQGEDAVKI